MPMSIALVRTLYSLSYKALSVASPLDAKCQTVLRQQDAHQ